MQVIDIAFGIRGIPSLEIVWRNPNHVGTLRRRYSVERAEDSLHSYALQEFVEDGDLGHWMTISDLEVLVGGKAA
jgi:hypothetical protein